ncbi:hypothetical protein [Actinoplanes sp. TFC3]|uniref:hypothetical protein n=1 Tax=Actinoplanes sp. TFC3 TaxID=1710355 RepID=UPI0009E84EC9|nr:hypothetical protein [Actinoplanes sp. TFC3]
MQAAETHRAPTAEVVVGLIAAPGASQRLTGDLVSDLQQALPQRHPTLAWRLPVIEDALVQSTAGDAELVAAARDQLLEHDWDLVICLTDLPVRVGRRSVVAHASPVHSVAVVSVPALGAVGVRRRALDTVTGLIDTLVGETDPDPANRSKTAQRLRELADDEEEQGPALFYPARVLTGNLRLLTGMVRANRPWRLAVSLSRALTAAVAAGVFALVTGDIWRLSDAFGAVRLSTIAVAAVVAVVVTLVVGGNLWERGRQRRQVMLFNAATVITVLIGVVALYAALFVLAAILAGALVAPRLLAESLGHPVGIVDYLRVAWFTSSLATVGGALGAGLESDEAVHEAAYTYRGSEEGGDR